MFTLCHLLSRTGVWSKVTVRIPAFEVDLNSNPSLITVRENMCVSSDCEKSSPPIHVRKLSPMWSVIIRGVDITANDEELKYPSLELAFVALMKIARKAGPMNSTPEKKGKPI